MRANLSSLFFCWIVVHIRRQNFFGHFWYLPHPCRNFNPELPNPCLLISCNVFYGWLHTQSEVFLHMNFSWQLIGMQTQWRLVESSTIFYLRVWPDKFNYLLFIVDRRNHQSHSDREMRPQFEPISMYTF